MLLKFLRCILVDVTFMFSSNIRYLKIFLFIGYSLCARHYARYFTFIIYIAPTTLEHMPWMHFITNEEIEVQKMINFPKVGQCGLWGGSRAPLVQSWAAGPGAGECGDTCLCVWGEGMIGHEITGKHHSSE